MAAILRSLRVTLRRLLRAPLFTGVAVLTLAVGIGSNMAIFSVVDGVLLTPLDFQDPDELVGLWHTAPGLGFPEVNQAPALHFYYEEHSRTLEAVGMWDGRSATVTGVDEPEVVSAMAVTHGTLPLLGVQAARGRLFQEADDRPGAPRSVVLSHAYWENRLGADAGVLDTTLDINGESHQVLGVLPPGLRFLDREPAFYLPFRFDRSDVSVGDFSYQGVARLAEGATLEQANAEVGRMIPQAVEAYPGGLTAGVLEQARFGPLLRPLEVDVVGNVGEVLWVLFGTVAIVLLIACANVANLFLVRAEGRQRELAIRTALGAGRRRIAGDLLSESLVLGVLGGVLGSGLAWAGLEFLVYLGPESLPRLGEIGLGGRVLLFGLGVSLVSGLLFGTFPALRFAASNLVGSLKEGGRGGSAGPGRHRVRNLLVVGQVALALVLLAGSGLMVRSFQALRSVDPGFHAPAQVLTFRISLPSAEVEELDEVVRTHREILRRIQALPGVATAALTSSATMDGWDSNDALESEANPVTGDQIPPIRRYKFVGQGYFESMGNPVLAGRDLTWAEVDRQARVVVVSEALARAEWGEDPSAAVGQRVRQSAGSQGAGPWYEVVGVVGDVRDDGVAQEPVAVVYWPQATRDFWGGEGVFAQRSMAFVVRAGRGSPTDLLPAVREAVWGVNPRLPLAQVRTLEELAAESMAQTSFTLIMLAIAAGVALFLGVVGLYGVVTYLVAQRTREIGVRMAMGAEQGTVRAMVLRQAAGLAGAGVLLGVLASLLLTRLMASLLYGVDPVDPPTLAAVSVTLAVVALAASWVPAVRASRVDPVQALRAEA